MTDSFRKELSLSHQINCRFNCKQIIIKFLAKWFRKKNSDITQQKCNNLCIQESINTSFFYTKITCWNSTTRTHNSKGCFNTQTPFLKRVLKIGNLHYTNQTEIWYDEFNQYAQKCPPYNTNFYFEMVFVKFIK